MATQMLSLSQPYGNRSAVLCTLAHYRARQEIKRQIQARGLKLANFSSREITIRAEAYFAAHSTELLAQAVEIVGKSPELRKLYEREQRQLRAKLRTNAQTDKQPKSTTSAVQMSGAQ